MVSKPSGTVSRKTPNLQQRSAVHKVAARRYTSEWTVPDATVACILCTLVRWSKHDGDGLRQHALKAAVSVQVDGGHEALLPRVSLQTGGTATVESAGSCKIHCNSTTHTHTHTDTQTHRHTETQRHRDTETQRHRDTGTQTHRHTGTQAHRDTETQRHRHTDTQTHGHRT
jgi:hypothetical protein